VYRISKQFQFSASHILEGLPDEHPCSRLHGHNYSVELVLESETLSDVGFIVDYNELKEFDDLLRERYDHRHLNDVVSFQPSAELLARHFYLMAKERWPQLVRTRLSETGTTLAEYCE
jgi:6-pyruvoyltetrahydropterin/6-carboxytetrahydropterin synthase